MEHRELIDTDLAELDRVLPVMLEGLEGEDRRLAFDALAFKLRGKWNEIERPYLDAQIETLRERHSVAATPD